jgi:hypothetical protein
VEFLSKKDIEVVQSLTGMTTLDEVLEDYFLFCSCAELEIGTESWTEYKDETENQF